MVPFGQPDWEREYGLRVGRIMDELIKGGATRVVWLLLPVTAKAALLPLHSSVFAGCWVMVTGGMTVSVTQFEVTVFPQDDEVTLQR